MLTDELPPLFSKYCRIAIPRLTPVRPSVPQAPPVLACRAVNFRHTYVNSDLQVSINNEQLFILCKSVAGVTQNRVPVQESFNITVVTAAAIDGQKIGDACQAKSG